MDPDLIELCMWIVAFQSSHEKAYAMCPEPIYAELHDKGYMEQGVVTEKAINVLENSGVLVEWLS